MNHKWQFLEQISRNTSPKWWNFLARASGARDCFGTFSLGRRAKIKAFVSERVCRSFVWNELKVALTCTQCDKWKHSRRQFDFSIFCTRLCKPALGFWSARSIIAVKCFEHLTECLFVRTCVWVLFISIPDSGVLTPEFPSPSSERSPSKIFWFF